MTRTIAGKPFTVCYTTELTSIIRGHHVYKEVWDAAIGEMLEAQNNMINALLVYTKRYPRWTYTNRNFKFIFPFHQSRSREQNKSIDNWKTTTGNWTCRSDKVNFHNNKRFSYVLENELVKRKNKFRTLTLKLKKKGAYRKFLFYLIK